MVYDRKKMEEGKARIAAMRKEYLDAQKALYKGVIAEAEEFKKTHTILETIDYVYEIGFDCVPQMLYICRLQMELEALNNKKESKDE